MKVVRSPSELEPRPRAVAIGSFDGVHRGHVAVVDAVRATGLEPTVITFDPHPRIALGNKVELLTTLDRRLELLDAAGVETVVVATFDAALQQLTPEEFAERYLRAIGVQAVVAGEDFRFGVQTLRRPCAPRTPRPRDRRRAGASRCVLDRNSNGARSG